MGSFDDHRRAATAFGILAAAVVAYLSHSAGHAPRETALAGVLTLVVAIVAGVTPDVDSHASIPRRYLGTALAGGALLGVGVLAARRPDLPASIGARLREALAVDVSPVALGTAVVAGVALLAARATGDAFDRVTVHRGWFHSPGFALTMGIVVLAALAVTRVVPRDVALAIGVVAALAVVVHTHVVDR